MAAIALLAPEVWEAVKLANIRGGTDEQLARQFDITQEAIRKRRSRDPAWQGAMVKPTLQIDNKENVTANVTKGLVETSVQEMLRQNGEQSSLRASQIAHKSLQSAPDSLPVKDAGDLKTLLSVVRIAAGMDRDQPQVQVNLAMFQGEAVTVEGEAWEVEGGVGT